MLKADSDVTRHMTVTPVDMRQPKFGTALRGFNRDEVLTFLEEAASGFDHALKENERLRQEIARLEGSIQQYRELEATLKSTMVSAQQVAGDIRENAKQEAARIVREAEGRAEAITERALARLEDIEREIDGLRLKRREAETSIEATISTLHNTLEFIREQEHRERESRIVPHPSAGLGAASTLLGAGPTAGLGANPAAAAPGTGSPAAIAITRPRDVATTA